MYDGLMTAENTNRPAALEKRERRTWSLEEKKKEEKILFRSGRLRQMKADLSCLLFHIKLHIWVGGRQENETRNGERKTNATESGWLG